MRRPSLQDNTAVSSMSSTPPEPIMEVPESERGVSHVSVNTGMDWAADASPTSYNPSETSYVTPLAVVEKENEANRIQEQRVLGSAESTQRLLLRCDEFDAWKAIMDAFYALVAEDERESSLREATSHPTDPPHPSQNNHNSHDSTNTEEGHLESQQQQQHTPKDTLIKANGESLPGNATPSPTPAVQDEANMNGKDRHTTQVGVTCVPLLPHGYGTALPASLHTQSEPLLTRGSMSAETTYDRNGSAEQVLRQFFWPLTILSGPPRSSPSSPCSPALTMVNYAATESEPRGVYTHSAAGRAAVADSTSAHPTDHRSNNNSERLLRGYRMSSRDRELPALQDVSAENWAFATHADRLSHKRDSLSAGGDKAASNERLADKSQPTSGNDYYWQSLWVNSVTRQYLFFLLSFLYLGSILVLGAVWTMIDVFAAAPLPLYRNSHTTATSRNALHATALVAALGLTLMIFTFTDGVALMRSARWPQALLLLGPSAVVVGAMLIYHGGLHTELGITLAGAAVYGVGLGLAVLAACMLSFVEVGVAAGMVAQLNITLLSFLTVNALAYLVLPTLYNSAVTSERTVLKAAVYMTAVPFLYAVALLLLVPRAHIARAVAANDRHFRTRKLFVAVRHVSGRFVLRTLSFALVFSLVVLAADNAAVLFAPLPSLMTSRRPSRFVTLDAATRTPGTTNNSEGVSAQVVLTTLGAQRVAAVVFVSAFMLWPLCFLPRLSSLLARSLLLLCAVIVMTLCWAAYARLPNGRRLVANAMWYMACACTTGVVFALLASSLLRSLLLIGESTWVVARRPGRETNTKEENGKRDEKGQKKDDRRAADERTALLPNAQQDTQKENRNVQPLDDEEEGTTMQGDAAYMSAQDIELHDGPSAVVSLGMGVLLSSLVVCTTVLAVTSMLLRREMTPASSGAANAAVMTLRAQLALKRMMLGLSVAAVLCELIQTALACRATTMTV